MAGGSLFTLLDDIASVLDDVAVLTKVAAKKTSGVLGDDLALNAQQVTGVEANRELPVIWAVAKGSALNKVILVPVALGISSFANFLITPLLMLGGAFLCFEGFEKIAHKFLHSKDEDEANKKAHLEHLKQSPETIIELEKSKIKGAIRTDFILSAEIIVITLGTVADVSMGVRIAVLTGISALMTVGVYGLVSLIVKIDDLGLWLLSQSKMIAQSLGRGLLIFAPLLMKFLSIAGTAAMFLVGGGIISHGFHLYGGNHPLGWTLLYDGGTGLLTGGLIVILLTAFKKIFNTARS